MENVIFLVQNLQHKSDSVGFDCIFEYRALQDRVKDIVVFADVFDSDLHENVNIRPFSEFFKFHQEHRDYTVIYHFCDGWDALDDYLIDYPENVFIRWHNNTPPWFYILEWPEFAKGALRGFKVLAKMVQTNLKFLVNSDFTKRQLEALGGQPNNIFSVFPGSSFLTKPRIPYKVKENNDKSTIDLLFVSRVVPHKGHKHILTISDIIQKYTGRKVNINFVGMVEDRMKSYQRFLLNESQKHSLNICFHGLLSEEELYQKYRDSDVFMCLSEHEGFGMPVFEAMRCGIPIVAWANTAMSDLLQQHPFASPLFDPYWLAAATLVAVERGEIDEEISVIQNELLGIYDKTIVEQQLICAVSEDRAFPIEFSDTAKSGISKKIAEKEKAIREKVKDIQTYRFDSTVNYFSLYDIPIYDRFLFDDSSNSKKSVSLSDGASFNKFGSLIRNIDVISSKDFREEIGDVQNIFVLDDECFVRGVLCYYGITNYDINVFKAFLRKLRKGEDKQTIFLAILDYYKIQDPSFSLSPNCFYNDSSFKIDRMEKNVRRLKRALFPEFSLDPAPEALANGVDIDELLYFENDKFIEYSFLYILGRLPDNESVTYYLGRFATDMDRTDFLRELVESEEAKNNPFKKVRGLDQLQTAEYGKVNFLNHKKIKSDLSKKISKLENEIGQIVMMLATDRMPLSIAATSKSSSGIGKVFPELELFFDSIVSDPFARKVQHIDELLALPDDEFICSAFRTILGRPVDQNGLQHYQNVLAENVDRELIVRELVNCEEARNYGMRLGGVERLLDQPVEPVAEEEQVTFTHIDEILALDETFLPQAFLAILGRLPDAHGLQYYEKLLSEGVSRESIIRDLASSDEAKAHGSSLVGLN